LERARADIAAGTLWKARDRLHGAFKSDPANQEVLNLLGQTLFDMGDLPAAGRYWYLTTTESEESERARRALGDRYGHNDTQIALALPVRAELDEFPPDVKARLSDLGERAKRQSKADVFQSWGRPERREAKRWKPPGPAAQFFAAVFGAALLLLFVVVLILGVQTLIGHIVRLFG